MTIEALQYMNDCLESLSIPYEFMQWTKDLSFPYFIGEYTEVEPLDEDVNGILAIAYDVSSSATLWHTIFSSIDDAQFHDVAKVGK